MRKWILVFLLLVGTRAEAQQINLSSLDKLAAKAKEKTEVSLDSSMLKFASGFLSDKSKDETAAKKITSELKGVYVRVYEFDKDGMFLRSDLDPVRDQLKGPQWTRIVNVQESGGDDVELWLHREGDMVTGLLLMAIESEEVAVINLVGQIRPEDLAELGGKMGIPKIKGLTK